MRRSYSNRKTMRRRTCKCKGRVCRCKSRACKCRACKCIACKRRACKCTGKTRRSRVKTQKRRQRGGWWCKEEEFRKKSAKCAKELYRCREREEKLQSELWKPKRDMMTVQRERDVYPMALPVAEVVGRPVTASPRASSRNPPASGRINVPEWMEEYPPSAGAVHLGDRR